jgi:hypothetical protein
MAKLSFVTLLAYDYKYAFKAIESYYDLADEIILGLDVDRRTWAGNPFYIDMSEVKLFIERVDAPKKIKIVEDNYHRFATAKLNDAAERNFLSLKCAPGNWIIQIDCDEFLLNPMEFRDWLERAPDDSLIKAKWSTVFKIFPEEGACLLVDGESGGPNIGTKKANAYISHRRTGQETLVSPLELLHFSWGRTRDDLKQKLDNWSHKDEFNTNAYLKVWDSVTLNNYQKFENIHPLNGRAWPRLKAVRLDKRLIDFLEPGRSIFYRD